MEKLRCQETPPTPSRPRRMYMIERSFISILQRNRSTKSRSRQKKKFKIKKEKKERKKGKGKRSTDEHLSACDNILMDYEGSQNVK